MTLTSIGGSAFSPTIAANTIPKNQLGSFEMNTKEFGPVAAGVIGVVQAVGNAGSTAATFSSHSLEQLKQAAQDVYSGIDKAVSHGVEELTHDALAVYTPVAQAASAVGSALSDAAGSVAGYAALGAVAAKQLVNELA